MSLLRVSSDSVRGLTLGSIERCQVVEAGGDVRMSRAQGLFPDGEGTLVEGCGLRVLALGVIEHS